MSPRCCLFVSAVSGFLAVALGAFGAHGLKGTDRSGFLERKYAGTESKNIAGYQVPASYKYLQDFETGVDYHMKHALAMSLIGVLLLRRRSRLLSTSAWCFLLGTVFFSGSLYVLVIGGPRWLGVPWGAITPVGGLLLLAGWACLAVGAIRTA